MESMGVDIEVDEKGVYLVIKVTIDSTSIFIRKIERRD